MILGLNYLSLAASVNCFKYKSNIRSLIIFNIYRLPFPYLFIYPPIVFSFADICPAPTTGPQSTYHQYPSSKWRGENDRVRKKDGAQKVKLKTSQDCFRLGLG